LPPPRTESVATSAAPGLKRELSVRDLALFAIACTIAPRWIAAAAHAGPGSILLWMLGAVLMLLPLARAVAALTVKYPGSGGMYIWTREDFGAWHGFLSFWAYWLGIAFWFPSAAIFYISVAIYTFGPSYGQWSENRPYLLIASLATIWLALITNLVGLRIGKWTENLGGLATWIMGVLLAMVGAMFAVKHGFATRMFVMPNWSWNTVSFWAVIAYATTGLELAGMMAGEIRDPERTMPRAAWIASAVTVLFYVGTTVAMLVVLDPAGISELTGLGQFSSTAGQAVGAAWLSPVIAMLILATALGQFGAFGTAVSRLPLAAGVDGLLPQAFGKVHPRWGTPHISILVLGAVASFLLVAIQLGDTLRAAYQELVSLMVITGFLPFGYIFGSAWKAGRRVSAVLGWAVTALAIATALIPTAAVTNVWLFEIKLVTGTLATIGSGWFIYRRALFQKVQPL